MEFTPTDIAGAYIVDLHRIGDERGFFARAFCKNEFAEHNMDGTVVQANLSFNTTKGTVRGLHYQIAPAPESKLVRCIRGSIVDVIVDMRPDSATYLQHIKVELDCESRRALFVPAMVAHGFQTCHDDTEVMYMVSGLYTPECERGLRADDPALGIDWPQSISTQSEKDQQWPLLSEAEEHTP